MAIQINVLHFHFVYSQQQQVYVFLALSASIFNYLFDLDDCEFKWNNIIQPFNMYETGERSKRKMNRKKNS